ncbi:MAG: MATE family efflux transporter [Schwartzia sp.]|nr:MATE family efflux transporter [Schwartzia sp. (in: firmicutes)]
MDNFLKKADRFYLSIAMPAAIEGIFMILLASADLIMVGSVGAMAVAAVGVFVQPRMALLTFTRSLASAVTLRASYLCGEGRPRAFAVTLLKQSALFGAVLLGAIHFAFWYFLAEIFKVMGATSEYFALAMDYGSIATIGVMLTSMAIMLQAVLLGYGKTAVIMRTNVIGNIVNVVVNAILIFGIGPFPRLGVVGAAYGTLVGTAVTLVLTCTSLYKDGFLAGGKWIPDSDFYHDIIPVSMSVFAEQGSERIGMLLFARMAADLGAIPFAVHSICMNICDFYYCFAQGFGKASMVLAGQAFGKKDHEDWHLYRQVGIKWTFLLSLLAFLLTVIFRDNIFSIYSSDPESIAMSSVIMLYVAAVSFPEAHALISAGVLRGTGHTSLVAAYSFLSVTVMRPILTAVFIYVMDWGIIGLWRALFIDQCIRALSSELFVRHIAHKDSFLAQAPYKRD